MEDLAEVQRITGLIVDAIRLSTDRVTAFGVDAVLALKLADAAQALHLARCIGAFTTDDALAVDMAEIVGETPNFMVSKVLAVHDAPDQCRGAHAEFEQEVWKSLYAGRRERERVKQTLLRRGVI